MKPTKVFYRGEEVRAIFNLVDKDIVDIAVGKGNAPLLRGVNRSELMIPLVEAEAIFNESQKLYDDIQSALVNFEAKR